MGTVKDIVEQVQMYYGEAVFLLVAIIAYLYLMMTDKDVRRKILYPIGFIIFCVVNPILYKLIFSRIIYWRLLWMFPDAIIIALAATKFIKKIKKNAVQIFAILATITFVVLAGDNVYTNAEYKKRDNWHKIPSEVKEVCDIILAQGNDARCVMPDSLYSHVRQYSGEIEMLYGRNVLDKYIINSNEASKGIYLELRNETPNYDYIFGMSHANNCNYVVLEDSVENDILNKYGYQVLSAHDDNTIYFNPDIKTEEPGGWLISQYGKEDDFRRTYISLENGNGELIIIDGGTHHNSYNIRQLINKYDKHVAAWIITNPHRQYSEALHRILEEHKDIQIDNIYTIAADKYNYQGQNVIYIEEDDTFEVEGLRFGVDYYVINEKKDYAMMCIFIEGNNDKITLRTSLNISQRKKYEETGALVPVFSEKVVRSVFR